MVEGEDDRENLLVTLAERERVRDGWTVAEGETRVLGRAGRTMFLAACMESSLRWWGEKEREGREWMKCGALTISSTPV
jgi:hypothetical protein